MVSDKNYGVELIIGLFSLQEFIGNSPLDLAFLSTVIREFGIPCRSPSTSYPHEGSLDKAIQG